MLCGARDQIRTAPYRKAKEKLSVAPKSKGRDEPSKGMDSLGYAREWHRFETHRKC